MDHYLPKSAFPRLAYCWDNLLPSCASCNLRKGEFAPPVVPRDTWIDPVLDLAADEAHYLPMSRLPAVGERLLEPTVDDPGEHLRFEPALHQYAALSSVGRTTTKRFFAEKSDAKQWQVLSDHVRRIVLDATSPEVVDQQLATLVALVGYEFYIEQYRAFWTAMRPR